jgi:hypothetical protein
MEAACNYGDIHLLSSGQIIDVVLRQETVTKQPEKVIFFKKGEIKYKKSQKHA